MQPQPVETVAVDGGYGHDGIIAVVTTTSPAHSPAILTSLHYTSEAEIRELHKNNFESTSIYIFDI